MTAASGLGREYPSDGFNQKKPYDNTRARFPPVSAEAAPRSGGGPVLAGHHDGA